MLFRIVPSLSPPLPPDWGLGFATQLPPLISGTGKATDFKFGRYIYRANQNKSPLKILEKMERGRFRRLPQFFGYPLLSEERIQLRTSNFVGTFRGSIRTKAGENVGNSSRGRSQGVPKIFRAPMYRVHCAVIFAIGQLSCYFVATDSAVCCLVVLPPLYTYLVRAISPYLVSAMTTVMICG